MTGRGLRRTIEAFVEAEVGGARGKTRYRSPLVGFADADDPGWGKLRRVVEATHLLPSDLLAGAKTVVAFFVPFSQEVVYANRRAGGTAREWATAYTETNALLNRVAAGLIRVLAERGIRGAAHPSTHNWDPQTLVSGWSHKSAAALAGLGGFGRHRMLITASGCAGRCGSLAIDAQVEATSALQPKRCLHLAGGTCAHCVRSCPVNALSEVDPVGGNLDRFRCYGHLLRVKETLGADACGKCAVGPCALGSAVKRA